MGQTHLVSIVGNKTNLASTSRKISGFLYQHDLTITHTQLFYCAPNTPVNDKKIVPIRKIGIRVLMN